MNLPAHLIGPLKMALQEQMGWNYTSDRSNDLLRGVTAAARDLGRDSVEDFVRELLAGPFSVQNLDALSKNLTIGETYFWREPQSLNLFKERVLPQLLATSRNAQRPLRIWSAGCSTGEEAYSLAILLCETLPQSERDHISILATDINPLALQKARRGLYGNWSFRSTPAWLKTRYCEEQSSGCFQVTQKIRQMVSFSALNLAAPTYAPPWGTAEAIGTIWCRNVLIYFESAQTTHVLSRFYHTLESGGYLIVAPCETSRVGLSEFTRVSFPEMTFFQKRTSPRAVASGHHPARRSPLPVPSTRSTPIAPITPAIATRPTIASKAPLGETLSRFSAVKTPATTLTTLTPLPASHTPSAEAAMEAVREAANAGRLEVALQLAQQALTVHKLEPGLHYLAATALQELGRLDEAGVALRKALYLDNDFVLAHFALANLARQRGQVQEAQRQLNTTLNLLRRSPTETILPESDGLTAGELMALISNQQKDEPA